MLYHPTILTFFQAILVLVFLVGAWSKLRARETFEGVVYNYRLLPERAVLPASYLLPIAELVVGLGLAYAPARPSAAIGAMLLLALFNVAIAINLARGRREIDCGCLSSALKRRLSGGLIARNVVLMGLAAVLAWSGPRSLAGAAGWLDWLVGLAAAAAAALIYTSATLLAAQGTSAHNSRQAG